MTDAAHIIERWITWDASDFIDEVRYCYQATVLLNVTDLGVRLLLPGEGVRRLLPGGMSVKMIHCVVAAIEPKLQ